MLTILTAAVTFYLVFLLMVVVLDLAFVFLQDIFKCDQTGHFTVFVQYGRDIKC